MRWKIIILSGLVGLSMQVAFANGFAHSNLPSTVTQQIPNLSSKKSQLKAIYPDSITATIYPGSLKANITRVARAYGWSTVVWNAPEDYLWIGKSQITASNLQGIFNKLLYNYPLQAAFYQGNHVLAISPRNLP